MDSEKKKPLENIVGKGKHGYHRFLLYPQSFFSNPFISKFRHLSHI